MRNSADSVNQAVQFLKSNSDRNKGWAGLLEACRTISGDTVYILQLVYGAELQKYEKNQFIVYVLIVCVRLILAAQQAKDLAASINPDTAASNPQLLADQGNEKIKRYSLLIYPFICSIGACRTRARSLRLLKR